MQNLQTELSDPYSLKILIFQGKAALNGSFSFKFFDWILDKFYVLLSQPFDQLRQIPKYRLGRNREYYKKHNAFSGHSRNRK